MTKIKAEDYGKYFFILLLVIFLILTFFVVRPFITAILASVIIAYVFNPACKFLKRRMSKHLAALIVVILIIIVITLPVYFTLNAISREARINYLLLKQKIISGNVFGLDCSNDNGTLCSISGYIETILKDPHTRYYVETGVQRVTEHIVNSTSNFLISLPLTLLNFIVMVLLIFFFLRDGTLLLNKFTGVLPLKIKHQKKLIERLKEAVRAIVYGYIVIAVIEGIITITGFYLADVAAPMLWGAVISLLAFIPFIGPPVVWVPVILTKISAGASLQAVIVIIVGIILFFIDTILKPIVIGDRAKIHPVLVMLGVVGGVIIFGAIGIVIGPVVITLFITLLNIQKEEKIVTFS